MYKTLCAAAVLLTALVFMSGSKSVGSSQPVLTTPTIVASGKMLNQTAPFSKLLFTAGTSGVYRLSTYATITSADPSSSGSWQYSFGWTDVTGVAQIGQVVLGGNDAVVGQFHDMASGGMNIGGTSRTFQASAGTSITHSMIVFGTPDASAYSVFYTLERLQ
jgi:hypothetical protein